MKTILAIALIVCSIGSYEITVLTHNMGGLLMKYIKDETERHAYFSSIINNYFNYDSDIALLLQYLILLKYLYNLLFFISEIMNTTHYYS